MLAKYNVNWRTRSSISVNFFDNDIDNVTIFWHLTGIYLASQNLKIKYHTVAAITTQ